MALRKTAAFPDEIVIGPQPEPRDYSALMATVQEGGDLGALDRVYKQFVLELERELGTYHGVLDQKQYFGRSEEPKYVKVSAPRTSGGKYPVGCPSSRG